MSKKLVVMQFFVVTCLILLVCLIGVRQKDFTLSRLKSDIIKASKKYVEDNNINVEVSESIVIYINDLIGNDYITDENIEEYCISEVVIFNGILQDEYKVINNCEKNEE